MKKNLMGVTIIFDREVYNLDAFIEKLRGIPGLTLVATPKIHSPRPWKNRGVRAVYSEDIPEDEYDAYWSSMPTYVPLEEMYRYPDGEECARVHYIV